MKCVSLCICIFTLLPVFIEAGLLLQENDKITEIVNSTILSENQPRFERQYADPCTNNPCYNDGICMVNGNSYVCNCKPPYFGARCELNPCTGNPCRNGGVCTLTQSSYFCTCIPPFVGTHCETTNTMDPCSLNPCMNGGTCYRVGDSYSCQCRSDYSGTNCQTTCTRKCKNGFCQVDAYGKELCNCLPEYGRISDTECKACNCGPGATCTFKGFFNTKTCTCPPPIFYEENGKCVELCGTKPCKNGKCIRTLVITYCQCDTDFSGLLCEDYNGKSIDQIKIYVIVGCVVIFVVAFMGFATYRYLQFRSRRY